MHCYKHGAPVTGSRGCPACLAGRLCIICRGIPGSGKSTWVKNYSHPCVVISTDNYFLDVHGEYIFDITKLGYYHGLALEEFKKAIDNESPTVILDNTNVRRRDYKKYVDFALAAGYTVVQKVFDGKYISTHNVPIETVEAMKDNFQVDTELPHWKEENDDDNYGTTK